MRATRQDGSHPRPLLQRTGWTPLDGPWGFAHDDADAGLEARWWHPGTTAPFDRTITVPLPPECAASGIGDPAPHHVQWYRRTVDLAPPGPGRRLLLHFEAVDHDATVWVNGHRVAQHTGGQVGFTADVTEALAPTGPQVLVVRAEDDPTDPDQPRGKQDWRDTTHEIWYSRTSGIWRPVWAEEVPTTHVADVLWTPDLPGCALHATVTLAGPVPADHELALTVHLDDELLAAAVVPVQARATSVHLAVHALRNGQDRGRLQWSPASPTLLDTHVVLRPRGPAGGTAASGDEVFGYTALRSVDVGGGALRLNGLPHPVHSVLDQGYRPDTHLAVTGTDVLRDEVETILALGFTSVRVHQVTTDPRFLHWADRLGLMVWAETAAAYAFSPDAAALLAAEWTARVRRDRGHPSVVAWVPVNESWGVPHLEHDPAQRDLLRGLAGLTRALDPHRRPVLSNEGWEHVDSDIMGVHDYAGDPAVLLARYGTAAAVDAVVAAPAGPAGRRLCLTDEQLARHRAGRAPLMLSEFGGISLADADGWGYTTAGDVGDYAARLGALFAAVHACPPVAGFCYTQLMDTGPETNGLLRADGTPKLPLEVLRRIVTGHGAPGGSEVSGGAEVLGGAGASGGSEVSGGAGAAASAVVTG